MQNTIVLVGLLIIAVIAIILLLVLQIASSVPTVKAGKMKDFEWKYYFGAPRIPSKIMCDGTTYSSADYDIKIVRGESMKEYGLHDKYIAFIHPFTEEERSHIDGFPTVELDIFYTRFPKIHAAFDSKTKLRRFVAYISADENDWEKVYKMYAGHIRLNHSEEFKKDFIEGKERLAKCKEMLILSETYDKYKRRNHYSLHPISSLRGRVDFYYPAKAA